MRLYFIFSLILALIAAPSASAKPKQTSGIFQPADLFNRTLDLRAKVRKQDEAAMRAFFEAYPGTREYFAADGVIGEYETKFGLDHLRIARADIDGDGIPELFVVISRSPFCGTIGCDGFVLKWRGKALVALAEPMIDNERVVLMSRPKIAMMDVAPPNRPCDYVWALIPPVNAGIRSFYTYAGGLFWNGREFIPFCLDRCGQECG